MKTNRSSLALAAQPSLTKVLLAMLASFALVFSFAVPASAATTITSIVKSGGGLAAGPTAGGTQVVITGTGFDTGTPAADYVKFGATNATSFTVNSATQVTATAPAGAAGVVSVTVGTIVFPSGFTYAAAPTITTVAPATGPLGGTNTVVITGTNFIGVAGATAVKFGGSGGTNATSYTVNSATQITAVVPARSAGAVDVYVQAAGGDVNKTTAYTYVSSPPTITSIGTRSGPLTGATTVVITGTNFHGVVGSAAVKFGANNATSYTVNSPTQITAVAPAGAAGTVNVLVTAVDGTATLSAAYTYRATSTAINASEKVFFSSGRSEIRSSQYDAFAAIALAAEGKTGIRVVVTSRRWSGSPASLGKARNTSVVKLLRLVGLDGANVTYNRFNTKATAGGALADKNNRVTITVSWTN